MSFDLLNAKKEKGSSFRKRNLSRKIKKLSIFIYIWETALRAARQIKSRRSRKFQLF